jgi:NAD(P)-dependent dehydrogenase (short-subunit alcohol dehydrogenase family)
MDLQLKGRTVLITGGSRGIGLATATTLAAEGCHVRLVARSAERLEEAAAQVRAAGAPSCEKLALDLEEPGFAAKVVQAFPEVDIVVNNAGEIPGGSLFDVSEEKWRRAWDVKVHGYMQLTKAYYPQLVRVRGAVVNIIGIAGELLDANYIAGSVGNAALIAFTKAFGAVSTADGVRVVGINPGPVLTDRSVKLLKGRAVLRGRSEDEWTQLQAQYPMGRMATPQEIADAVAFLASPRSGYTSGCVLNIDAGVSNRNAIA